MAKIDIDQAPYKTGCGYPSPHDEPVKRRSWIGLGTAGGLTQFGVNLLSLPPACWSSQRHWHATEDEFLWVLEGEVVQITNAGETILRAGDCAAYPAGEADGHHLVNRTTSTARLLIVGSRREDDVVTYSDIDMMTRRGSGAYTRKDGTPLNR